MNLLPYPNNVEFGNKNTIFSIFKNTQIYIHKDGENNPLSAVLRLQSGIDNLLGIKLSITASFAEENDGIQLLINAGEDEEGYEIIISQARVKIIGFGFPGLRYGIETILQIVSQYKTKLPIIRIKDNPGFPVRGFLYDVTRGKTPKLETLYRLVDSAVSYKLNQFQLYIEHSFAFKDFTEIWGGNDPLTAEEILLLDEYCRINGVELVPCLATFGHLYMLLSSRSYSHLCEKENSHNKIFSFFNRQREHTIDVSNPESINFVKSMINEFLPLFSSDKINICADETFDLGSERSKNYVAQKGKGRAYTDFILLLIDVVKNHEKTPMIFGDVLLNHPEIIEELPEDIILLDWNYEENPKIDERAFFGRNKRSHYVIPTVAGWNRLVNKFDSAYKNISSMALLGSEYNALGILNSDWGDYGHINPVGNVLPGMAMGASFSWNPHPVNKLTVEQFLACWAALEYGQDFSCIGKMMVKLGRNRIFSFCETVLWIERSDFSGIKDYSTEEVLSEYTLANNMVDKYTALLGFFNGWRKESIEELIMASEGTALFTALYPFVLKYELKKDNISLIIEPWKHARDFELWLQSFCEIWRIRNKESELEQIKRIIRQVCRLLRDCKRK